MTFRIETTAEAERDADAILEGLSPSMPEMPASDGSGPLKTRSHLLPSFLSVALIPESRFFPFEVRHLLYGHLPHVYRILFTIEGGTVSVLHIRHGRRKLIKR